MWWLTLALAIALVIHAGQAIQARWTVPATSHMAPTASMAMLANPADESQFVDNFLEVAEAIDPRMAEQLRSTCQLDPGQFARALRQLGPALGEMVQLREEDPALYSRKIKELQLEAAIDALASQIRRDAIMGAPENPARRIELQALVQAELAASRETQLLLLERMHAELAQAEAEMVELGTQFQQRVDERMKALIGR